MMRRFGDRVHFLHLRNVTPRVRRRSRGSFHEAEHLGGDTDMVAVIAAVVAEERAPRAGRPRRTSRSPSAPTTARTSSTTSKRKAQPGYPAIGRLKGLAELRGIMTALTHPASGCPPETSRTPP